MKGKKKGTIKSQKKYNKRSEKSTSKGRKK